MKTMLTLVVAASLTACATVGAPSAERLDQLQARYDQVKVFAGLLLPYLPADHAARIRLAGQIAERALAAARTATSVAEQRAALSRAEAAIGDVDAAVDRP